MALNLQKLITSGIKTADRLTGGPKGAQCELPYRAWVGQDEWGKPVYDPPSDQDSSSIFALVEQKLESRLDTATGRVIETKAKLTILKPVPPNGAGGRIEPIDPRDLILLPDGTSGPIYLPQGMTNPGTGQPFMLEVWIGVTK